MSGDGNAGASSHPDKRPDPHPDRHPDRHSSAVATAGWKTGSRDVSAIRALLARATAVDGVQALSGHVMAALGGGTANYLPVPTTDRPPGESARSGDPADSNNPVHSVDPERRGAPVLSAVAVAVGADPAEVVVDPRARRAGLGTRLVQAALTRQGGVWAYGDLPAAVAVAGRLRLTRTRELLQLRRALAGVDDPSGDTDLPADIRIRTFVTDQDEEQFLAVNARAFAWHPEQGRLDLAGLRAEMAEPWFDPAGFFLAVRGDRVVGFHWTKVHLQDPTPGPGATGGSVGEVYVLGVDPDAHVRGLGTPLTEAGLAYLREQGLSTVLLYVEGDNAPALRLYQRFGFRTAVTNVVYRPTTIS